MRRRGFRARGGSGRLLGRVRDRSEFGFREVRALDRVPGAPDGVEIGVGRTEGEAPTIVVASSTEGPALLGWAGVGMQLVDPSTPPMGLLIAAPVVGARTRSLAARLAGRLPAIRLVAIPALAESPEEPLIEERFPPLSDAAAAASAGGGILDRVVRILEGATALTGVGAVRAAEDMFFLYMRGVLVLRFHAEGEGVALTFVEPEKRQVHIREGNFPRWGVDLHEQVVQIAQDPRLLERPEVARAESIETIAASAGVRLIRPWVPWDREGSRPVDWVGVDATGSLVLGLVRRGVGIADLPAVIGALGVLIEDAERWTAGAGGPTRVVVSSAEYDPRFEAGLAAFDIDVERTGAREAVAESVARAPVDRERRGRRRSRRRRRGRGEEPSERPTGGARAEPPSREAERVELEPEPEPEEELQVRGAAREEEPEAELSETEPEEISETEPEEILSRGVAPVEVSVEEVEEEEIEEDSEEGGGLDVEIEEGPIEAVAADEEPEAALEKPLPRPRRPRAAIVVHCDPDSILAGLVLARDRRNIVLFWVCRQDELMDFFKTGATDLSENVDILLVGFTAQPVPKEILQTAEIYRGRLIWLDHHAWPVEDLELLRQVLGEESLVIAEGAAGPLAAVSKITERRSRFTDKLVDFSARRLSENDMRKWGYRLAALVGRLAERRGDCRNDVIPVLTGKPSTLPEAEAVFAREEAWLEQHDPRVLYFGEYQMVTLHVPEDLDAGEIARRTRLQTKSRLSLVSREGDETVLLAAGEERRHIDLQSLADRIAARLPWAELRPAGDRAARIVIDDLPRHPERLELLVSEIARHKSILYG